MTKIVTTDTINDPESSVIKDSSYRSDLNDGNGNGDRSETLLRKDTNSIGWSNNDQVIQEKMVQPKYTDEKYSKRSQTAAIPEGTSYTYELIQQYTGINDSTSLLYKHSTFADTMPHEGDKETSNFDVTTKTYSLRHSQWSGWLQDLDSIKMEYTDTTPTEEGDIKGKYELRIASAKDPVTGQTLSPQASVWVGPIATAGTGANVKYTPLTTDDIYEPIDAAKAAEAAAGGEWAEDENDEYITRWVTEKTTGLTLGEDGKTVVSEVPVSQSMASINMVNINDLKDYVKRHPAEEEALTRCIGAIWCRVLDDSLVLMARNGDVRLKYDLKAPLNLPKYLGNAGKTYKSIDGLQEGATPLQEYLYKTSQWNTFMSMVDYLSQDGEQAGRRLRGCARGLRLHRQLRVDGYQLGYPAERHEGRCCHRPFGS